MDNISRDSNSSSYLPVAGVILGVIAVGLSIGAIVKASKAASDADLKEQIARIDTVDAEAKDAVVKAESITKNAALRQDMQTVINQIGSELGRIDGEVKAIQDAAKTKVVAG